MYYSKTPQCALCDTPNPQLSYCNKCYVDLCETCVEKHVSSYSVKHRIVTFKERKKEPKYPKCSRHIGRPCKRFCLTCNIPSCGQCYSSYEHKGHYLVEFFANLAKAREEISTDLQELENSIYPEYQKFAPYISSLRTNLKKDSRKLANDLNKRREELIREIDDIINKVTSDFVDIKNNFLFALNKQEHEIKQTVPEVIQSIEELKKLSNSNDRCLVSEYISRNAEFRMLLNEIEVCLPIFTPGKLNKKKFWRQFGSLSLPSVQTENHINNIESSETSQSPPVQPLPDVPQSPERNPSPPVRHLPDVAQFPVMNPFLLPRPLLDVPQSPETTPSPPLRPLLDVPQILKTIDTGSANLSSVALLSDEELWTTGNDCIITLHNLQGQLLQSVQTKSGIKPSDIAVTWNGDLVYIDPPFRTVNKVLNTQVQELLTLREWRPRHVCCTITGDILVVMVSDDKQTKVVRYFAYGSKEIQFNDKGDPLYSSGQYSLYISSNRNGDICVADNEAGAVVVVSESGKFRFTYTGSQTYNRKLSFIPVGIATDGSFRILTSDRLNNCIHIIDQNGEFLRYIDSCDLDDLWGLCVDTKDNIFVAEWKKGQVKKIQYCEEIN